MNRGEEDYIKVIYELESRQQGEGPVTNLQLSQYLSHTAQTVNEMVKKLARQRMVEYTPYKGSRLTTEGRAAAARMIRVHRIWETFLVEWLGYSWDEVHEEAEGLEHFTTKKLEERLFAFLGEPEACPHGNRIPKAEEESVKDESIRLVDAREQEEYSLKRVPDDKELLTYLNSMGIGIGQLLKVTRIDPVSEIIELLIDGRTVVVGYKVAKQLFVCQC